MRARLVVNPKATATTARVRDVLAHALASEVRLELAETKSRGHAVELGRRAAEDGVDLVVALGGDGTVNEVVNGLLADWDGTGPRPDGPALAVVPGGSTNVFARALGLPRSAVEATGQVIEAVEEGRRRTIGLGRADDRWFVFAAGLGIDAAVVRRVERARARGRRATPQLYVRLALTQFFLGEERRQPSLVLERPGSEPEPVGIALVCNTAPWTYLGPRPVLPCPDASFDSGLDVFALRRLRTAPTLRHLAQILSSQPRLRGRQVVTHHDLDELVVRALSPSPFQVDGDDLGDRTEVRFRAVPAALDVVV